MKQKPVRLRDPFPTTAQVAKKLGASKKDVREAEKLVRKSVSHRRIIQDPDMSGLTPKEVRRRKKLIEHVTDFVIAEQILSVIGRCRRDYAILILMAYKNNHLKLLRDLKTIKSLADRKAWEELDIFLEPYRPKGLNK